MSSMEHPATPRSIPAEFALLLLLAAFITGLVLAWP